MEVCRHKQTKRYFIFLDSSSAHEALLVTPMADIKSIEVSQFDEVEEYDDDYLMNNGLVEQNQVKKFYEYRKNRSDEAADKVKRLFEKMPSSEKKKFIEYLKQEYKL
jgi:hypothetical protein